MNRIESELISPEGTRSEGDLIRITARADSPEKAAAIANAWAEAYVQQTNLLYGQVPTDLVASVQSELTSAQAAYAQAQSNLEAFIAENQLSQLDRQITEKQQIINSLQTGKQTAIQTFVDEELEARRQIISAYINAQASNRLLAFNKEQAAKQSMISTLIDAESNNRLKAIQADQDARQQLFSQVTQAELENQLMALSKDQDLRRKLFTQYVQTQLDNQLLALRKIRLLGNRSLTSMQRLKQKISY